MLNAMLTELKDAPANVNHHDDDAVARLVAVEDAILRDIASTPATSFEELAAKVAALHHAVDQVKMHADDPVKALIASLAADAARLSN